MLKNKFAKVESLSLRTGSVIAILIIITPYLFYLYEGFPDVKIWKTSFFTYQSNAYGSIYILAWTLTSKLIPLMLLLIWFFTCKHWWYHALMVPICMYVFQTYSTLNEDLLFTDTNEIYILAFIVFFSLIFLYTVRTRIFDKIHNINLHELNRVNIKGEIKNDDITDHNSYSYEFAGEEDDDEDDDEPLYMG